MKKILRILVKGYGAVERTASLTAAWCILVLMFMTSADVIGRYFFNRPIHAVYEVSQNVLIAVVFLSIAYVASVRGHPKIDIVTTWLPWKGQLAIDIFGWVLALVMMAIVTWQTVIRAYTSWLVQDYSTGLVHIPLWPAKLLVPIGVGMLCIRLILIIVEDTTHLVRGIPPEAREQIAD